MANLPSKDIADMLVADTIVTSAVTVFINKEPGDNDTKIGDAISIIYDTGGFEPEATGKIFDKPNINIRVKGSPGDYTGAAVLAQAIKVALHQRTPETINGTRYMGIWQIGEIAFVEYDKTNRPVFTLNFRMHRTYA